MTAVWAVDAPAIGAGAGWRPSRLTLLFRPGTGVLKAGVLSAVAFACVTVLAGVWGERATSTVEPVHIVAIVFLAIMCTRWLRTGSPLLSGAVG